MINKEIRAILKDEDIVVKHKNLPNQHLRRITGTIYALIVPGEETKKWIHRSDLNSVLDLMRKHGYVFERV